MSWTGFQNVPRFDRNFEIVVGLTKDFTTPERGSQENVRTKENPYKKRKKR